MRPQSKKIILIGNFGVGKTSLTRRFVHQKFSDEYLTTLGVKIDKKLLEVDGKQLNMIIWDIAGEVTQSKVPKSYYLGANGIIYVFDLTRPSTFEHMKTDFEYIHTVLPRVPYCIVGNKRDLVPDETIEKTAELIPMPYDFFTSAKTGVNVEEMFIRLSEKML